MKACKYIIAVLVLLVSGCTFLQPKVRWCEQIPQDSYSIICEIAHAVNTEPEEIAMSFKLVNIAGLSIPLYDAQQAMKFFDDVQKAADEGRKLGTITYEDLIQYVLDKYAKLSPAVRALIIISKDYYTLDLPSIKFKSLSDYDWNGIDKHIADQKLLIMPFLLAG